MHLPLKALRFLLLPLLLSQVSGDVIAQLTPFHNKLFYNEKHTNRVERNTAAVDRIYQMVDPRFHKGWGKGAGFTIVIQDVDQATSELVKVGFVRPAKASPDLPDVSQAGQLAEGTFKLFGSGSGSAAYIWTLTLGTRVVLPAAHGMSIELPSAKLNSRNQITDGAFLHNQSPASLQLPKTATPKYWMYVLSAGKALRWDSRPGGTWRFGALYEAPVAQVYIKSKAYGKPGEALRGPESLFPSFVRGDLIAWDLESKGLAVTGSRKPGLAFVMLGALALNPSVRTPFGELFINPAQVMTLPLLLDKAGRAGIPGIPIPKAGIAFHTQTVFFDPNVAAAQSLSLSDAQFVVTH